VRAQRDLPDATEIRFAYGTALTASFVWVACVMPGVRLVDPSLPDDLAAPMHRGSLYVVPALLLLVAIPISVVLSRQRLGLRGLLAWTSTFVALYVGVALAASHPRGFVWVVIGALAVIAGLSAREGWLIGRAGLRDLSDDVVPRGGDVRLALAILALLTPAGLLVTGVDERATWLAPFVFLAIGAAGERFAYTLRSLRIAAAVSLITLAAHAAVAVRFSLDDGSPASSGQTAWGVAAFVLALLVLALAIGWTVTLVLRRRPRLAVDGGE
jgi:hypothetical protein